ncbi:MAG: protein kinase domain-containing protein [Gemmatimonadaceae bacterium]
MNGETVLSGTFAGRYEVERELGRGATAIVYLARDLARGHDVAVKVLRPEFAGSLGAERFLKEIRLSQRLSHPQILPVLDSGQYEGVLFFVLPHMQGGTLRTRLEQQKQLSIEDAVSITRSVADALAHAHERGLVHRDVKPENILFNDGMACLGDFGIARALEHAMGDTTTSDSVVRGTPSYMSPEQAAGDRSLDYRSDIYSLGCVTYEMLAGMQPFVGPTPQSVIAQRLSHPPPSIRIYRPTLPPRVELAIARALAISPADRFQKATEFAAAVAYGARPTLENAAREFRSERPHWIRYTAIAGAAVLATIAAVVTFTNDAPNAVVGIPEGDPRRLAVLYFDDLSPNGALGHVAAGLTENLIDQLSQVQVLRVISPNGVRAFRHSDLPLDTVARRLGAGTIIGGSVSSLGAIYRVTVRLIDARTGSQLNSRTMQHPRWSLFRLQDSVASDVALWLREHLGQQVRLRAQLATTTSVPAWELVQRGEALAREAGTLVLRSDPTAAQLFERADSAFAAAERIDPKWPVSTVSRARNAISRAFVQTDHMGRPTGLFASQLHQAVGDAQRALAQSPMLPEALAVRGEARMRLVALANAQPADSLLRLADADLQRATSARPDVARSWYALGVVRVQQGRFADAADAFETAYQADAFLSNIRAVVSELLYSTLLAGRFDEADRWCHTAQTRYPDDPRFSQCALNVLGWAGRNLADAGLAWRLLERIERSDTTAPARNTWSFRRVMVAAVLARARMRDSARAVLTRAHAQRGERPTAALAEAYVRVLLGEHDQALGLITSHLSAMPNDRAVVRNHPWFRELHRDERFSALVAAR